MRLSRPIFQFGLLILLVGGIGLFCTKNPSRSKSESPTGPDTVPHIIGAYTGSATLTDQVLNTYETYSANLEVDSATSTVSGCGAGYLLSIGKVGSGTRSTYGFNRTVGQISWDCSNGTYRWHIDAAGDGKALAGTIDQWQTLSPTMERHKYTMSFNVTR
ncbi:MAG: hypothetical protein WAU88_15270 [Candidatus Zixiibacteriota bacterium]